jgi:flagellar protein FlbD
MITLIRLNGRPFLLNATLIEQIEAFPDTTITLINGKKIVVQNPIDEVNEKVRECFNQIGLIAINKDVEGS